MGTPVCAVVDLDETRFRRLVADVHRLGPRVTAEVLEEIGAERSIMTLIEAKLERVRRLHPDQLRAAGADEIPVILHEVPPR